jgi:hypothetical protein
MSETVPSEDLQVPPLTGDEELIVGLLLCDRPVSQAWLEALNRLRSPVKKGFLRVRSAGQDKMAEIVVGRNELGERALAVGARKLFFLDDDVVVPQDALMKLFGALRVNPNTRIAGGLYPRRGDGRQGNELLVWDDQRRPIDRFPEGKPFFCGGLAAGCMLIDLSVLSALKKPWFRYERSGQKVTSGEDELFCEAVRAAGYQILAHGGVLCQHVTVVNQGTMMARL